MEQGQLLTEALKREIREETGLEVLEVGQLVHACEFLNIPEALEKLEGLPWDNMRAPAIEYLRNAAQTTRLWQYWQNRHG